MAIEPDFDKKRLEDYLGGPVMLAPVAGGQSNPTWFVTIGEQQLVLRKKPSGSTLSSAHAVDREYRVMAALASSGVPVPKMVRLEEDPEVLGTPFYLMTRLEGRVFNDSGLQELAPSGRAAIYSDAARVLACLHQVDWRAAGLTDFGKSGDYYARQVRRWNMQWERSKTREDTRIDALSDWFAHNIPAENPTAIVHGDYRIGNLMIALETPRISGVLDWELSTLGDPMADLAHFSMFWLLSPSQLGGLSGLDLKQCGIPDQQEFMEIYQRAGGIQAPLTPFHRAFAFYRMSVIFEGITSREKTGQAVNLNAKAVGALAPLCVELAENIISSDLALPRVGERHGL